MAMDVCNILKNRVSPACTVPPISTAAAAAAATETYYFSKCWQIDLTRHIVTQNSSLSNHRLPVHCLSAFRQLKERKKIWSAPGSWATVQRRWKCKSLCHSYRSWISLQSYVWELLSAHLGITLSDLHCSFLNQANNLHYGLVFWKKHTFSTHRVIQ